jgi:ribosome recycling factor
MPMYTYLHLQNPLTQEYENKMLQNLAARKTYIPSLRHMRPRSNFRDKVMILYFSVKWYPISENFTYWIPTKYLSV